jgi:hypothetical protein
LLFACVYPLASPLARAFNVTPNTRTRLANYHLDAGELEETSVGNHLDSCERLMRTSSRASISARRLEIVQLRRSATGSSTHPVLSPTSGEETQIATGAPVRCVNVVASGEGIGRSGRVVGGRHFQLRIGRFQWVAAPFPFSVTVKHPSHFAPKLASNRCECRGRFLFVRDAIHFRSRGGLVQTAPATKREGVLGSYAFPVFGFRRFAPRYLYDYV